MCRSPPPAGKSTLLRLLMGREKPLQGSVYLGEHNIVPNYFEQVCEAEKPFTGVLSREGSCTENATNPC
jgi:ABC-type multidrug transport system ATPase subunit